MSTNSFLKLNQWLEAYGSSGKLVGSVLIFTPGLCLVAYWLGGEIGLTLMAVLLPFFAALMFLMPNQIAGSDGRNGMDILGPVQFETKTKETIEAARLGGQKSAVFVLTVDDYGSLVEHHGEAAMDSVRMQIRDRIRGALRSEDIIGAKDNATFAICLRPQPMLDLETCLEFSGRLNRTIAEPYAVDGTTIFLTSSLGFCQLGRETAQSTHINSDPVSLCADTALATALSAAPGAIRAFTPDVRPSKKSSHKSDLHPAQALENGEIVPWFQPQISTDTGKITGFEALARWIHPERGAISPGEFLPQMEEEGLMGRLSEVMLYNAMSAIKAWDQAGTEVKQVGVNFSPAELNDPKLVEKISWELDRFELAPNRIAVEILETVVAKGPDDVVTRNIKGLSALGCSIDLDDFGTGHASLASIRRFGVGRIKIDRSFVMKSDRDSDQQRMIRAILTLAEKLDIETLAEGVETVGEHSLLAQLGCTHVQGFGIARPMPFEQTLIWIDEHNSKLQAPPNIGRATG